jgi:hypothetical protein
MTRYVMRSEMKGIHRATILSPLLFLLGCAVIGGDAQESISQMDSDGPGSGGPTLQPRMAPSPSEWFNTGWSVQIPAGQLSLHAGESVECDWLSSKPGVPDGPSTKLTLQGSDGNLVFYNHSNGKTWGAHTRAVDNPNGPGITAAFQGDANLVVRNAAGNAIWASNTHTFPQAVLAFQSDGNLVIYNRIEETDPMRGITFFTYHELWETGTATVTE